MEMGEENRVNIGEIHYLYIEVLTSSRFDDQKSGGLLRNSGGAIDCPVTLGNVGDTVTEPDSRSS